MPIYPGQEANDLTETEDYEAEEQEEEEEEDVILVGSPLSEPNTLVEKVSITAPSPHNSFEVDDRTRTNATCCKTSLHDANPCVSCQPLPDDLLERIQKVSDEVRARTKRSSEFLKAFLTQNIRVTPLLPLTIPWLRCQYEDIYGRIKDGILQNDVRDVHW
jgi:hypothetical protein